MSEKLKIRVKYHDDGKGEPLKKIEKITIGDWIDLRCAKHMNISCYHHELIPLGVSMKLPEGYEAHIVLRSSTFKLTGLIQTNSMGIIDNSYSGDDDEWKMPVYAIRDTLVVKNDRICQFRIIKHQPVIEFVEVAASNDGEARGGFGSTGVN